ncbi:MAG: GFA family protein [Candidatus Eremiobacteraeota bacterium]|nr:GFA family protein [Candidatus Eremiobacteraeota bacterium]
MPLKTYQGSCHCQKVRFQADIDLEAGTGKCNCSFCIKVRDWIVLIKPEAFQLLSDASELGDYGFTSQSVNRHLFCQHCGVRLYSKCHLPELGGDFISIMVSVLDGISDEQLVALPVQFFDGRHDNWFEAPKVTAHL